MKRYKNLLAWLQLKFTNFCWHFLFLSGIVLIPSCRHPVDSHGIPLYIPNYFWNYYERGMAYTLVQEWEKAARDFQIAIGELPGAVYPEEKEKWRARTYGLHYYDDYFPQRELGVCYYFMGDLPKAEEKLRYSIDHLPSSRAKDYLNKILRLQYGQSKDAKHQSIDFKLNLDPAAMYVNNPLIKLIGSVSSSGLIQSVTVNGNPELVDFAKEAYPLDKKINLKLGKQLITIQAENLVNVRREWQQEIILDLAPPSISLSLSPSNPTSEVRINVSDNEALESLKINNKTIQLKPGLKNFDTIIELQDGAPLKIEVEDKAGNKMSSTADEKEYKSAIAQSLRYHPDNRLAFRQERFSTGKVSIFAQFESTCPPQNREMKDEKPPFLTLENHNTTTKIVTSQFYTVRLKVKDEGGIESVSFGHFLRAKEDSLQEKKLSYYEPLELRGMNTIRKHMAQTFELQQGLNRIEIIAIDRQGNKKRKEITVQMKPPHSQRQDLRMPVATLVGVPIPNKNHKSKANLSTIPPLKAQLLYNALASLPVKSWLLGKWKSKRPARFNPIRKAPNFIAKQVFDMELLEIPNDDFEDTIKKLPREDIEDVWLLWGIITPWGGKKDNDWILKVEIWDVKNVKKLKDPIIMADIHFDEFELKTPNHGELIRKLSQLANLLEQQMPILSSTVSRSHRSITLPLCTEQNVMKGSRVLFFDHESENVDAAEPKEDGRTWIQGLVIKEVSSEASKECWSEIETLPKGIDAIINSNDKIIIR